MFDILLSGIALVMIFEGLLPFLSPPLWRDMLARVASAPDHVIRYIALALMLIGVAIILYVHNAG